MKGTAIVALMGLANAQMLSGPPDLDAIQPTTGVGSLKDPVTLQCDYAYDCMNVDIGGCCAAFWPAETTVNYNAVSRAGDKWCVTKDWREGYNFIGEDITKKYWRDMGFTENGVDFFSWACVED